MPNRSLQEVLLFPLPFSLFSCSLVVSRYVHLIGLLLSGTQVLILRSAINISRWLRVGESCHPVATVWMIRKPALKGSSFYCPYGIHCSHLLPFCVTFIFSHWD